MKNISIQAFPLKLATDKKRNIREGWISLHAETPVIEEVISPHVQASSCYAEGIHPSQTQCDFEDPEQRAYEGGRGDGTWRHCLRSDCHDGCA